MNLQLRTFFLAIILMVGGAFTSYSQNQIELLNRGLFVLNKGDGTAYMSWRLLVRDDNSIGFNIYRSTAGGTATKLNSTVLTSTTDYVDSSVDMTQSNSYHVVTVVNNAELETSEIFTLPANPVARQFMPISLQAVSGKNYTDYNVLHVYPGDIDGDGDYDYIVKRMPVDASYNTILLDCYDNNGVFKWRIDLGPNVDTYISTMTSPVLVADFDSDGKAEIIVKTGESTIFGNGYTIPDTDGDGITDYNGHMGSGSYANVMAGPEFVSYVDGETGVELDRDNFLSRRDPYSDWGDTYGARMNFMMSSVGYFDGVHPAVVFSRGDGGDMDIDAWQIYNGQLTQLWYYTARGKTYSVGGWTDFHQIQCIDVDGDGKDEISWGACMLDNDGSLLYTTKYVHGDRFQITDIDPNRPGLEVFIVQQYHPDMIGSALYDAATGQTIKDWYVGSVSDIGRGDAADIDPNSPGIELYDTGSASLHSATGTEVTGTSPYPWVGIWWDGDLLRENLIGVGSGGYNPAISKWNPTTGSEDRLFSTYNDGGAYSVTQPYGGRVPFVGDILGDWREEIVLETSDRTQLRVYTTKINAQNRIYTLMQNPSYRMGITTKAYLCTKYPDYFLGAGMSTPPTPNVTIVGEAGSIALQATAGDGSVTLDWSATNVGTGVYEVLRDTDSDPAGRGRVSYAVNVNTYTDNTVTNGTTYYYWIKATANGTVVTSNTANATPSGCVGTAITPYSQVDGGSWSQATEIPVDAGSTVKFGPWPTTGGSWLWSGPNGYSATTREITISAITASMAGDYIATYTNTSGCESYQIFVISVNSETATTITIQEDETGFCSVDGSVDTNNAGYTGTGFANTSNASGNGITWSVNAASTGNYTFAWSYANGGTTDRTAQLMVDGSTVVSNVSMPSTGLWTTWSLSGSTTINLTSGTHLIRLQATTSAGLGNVDYINVTGINPQAVSCTGLRSTVTSASEQQLGSIAIYPNPFNSVITISLPTAPESTSTVKIYNAMGKLMHSQTIIEKETAVDLSTLAPGVYLLQMNNNGETKREKLIKQ